MWVRTIALGFLLALLCSTALLARGATPEEWEQVRRSIPVDLPEEQRALLAKLLVADHRASSEARNRLYEKAAEADTDTKTLGLFLISIVANDVGYWHDRRKRAVPHTPATVAAQTLGHAHDRFTSSFIEALQHESASMRLTAVRMPMRGPSERVVEVLIELLNDPEPGVRAATVDTLAFAGVKEAADPIVNRWRDESPLVRAAVAQAIGLLEQAGSAHGLTVMSKDADPRVRYNAIHSLGEINATSRAGAIIPALKDHDPQVRSVTLSTLGELANYVATPHLLALLESETPKRRTIVFALGKVGDPRATETLVDLLKSEEHQLAAGAAQALGMIRDRRAVEPLIRATQDRRESRQSVRQQAAEGLGRIGDAAATEAIISLLDDDYEPAVRSAILALGALNDFRAIEPLIETMYRPRRAGDAADALGMIRHPDVVRRLVETLPESNPPELRDGRFAALRALNRITGESFSDADPRTADRWREWLGESAEVLPAPAVAP